MYNNYTVKQKSQAGKSYFIKGLASVHK